MPVTLKDIAAEAGVSQMTVSNVMNGKHARVSEATIERVRRIAARRGYVPNQSARSLAAKRSRLIGFIVPDGDDHRLMLNPHNVAVFGALEQRLRQSGYHLLFRGVRTTGEAIEAIKSWNLAGALLLGFLDEDIQQLAPPPDVPVVALDSYADNPLTVGVRSDDRHGGRLAARALLTAGHRRIVFAGPEAEGSGVMLERLLGFQEELQAQGIPWDSTDRIVSDTEFDAGIVAARDFSCRFPAATAIFATADVLAVAIMAALSEQGLRVPDDISIVGYDDVDVARYVRPALSTIHQDLVGKVDKAVDMLLSEIDHKPVHETAIIDVTYVPRGTLTSARPRFG